MIYVHHHLGLGDHIACAAMVRELYKKFPHLELAVKKRNYSSVRHLFTDLDITYHLVETDHDCIPRYFTKPTLRIGHERCRLDWEKSFYDQLGMDYSIRYDNFYLQRDHNREKSLEDNLDLPEKYCFVCDTTSEQTYDLPIQSNLPKVKLEPITDSIFDWVGVIEKATEIHTVDTSVFQLIKQLGLDNKKVFYALRRTLPATFEDNSWETISYNKL